MTPYIEFWVVLFFSRSCIKFLHVGFVLVTKRCPVFFFFFCRFLALRFREITYAKNSVFLAASFGDLLLNEKQKKPFVSLNNEVSEASH